jgi:MFS superfamily sulfate permease-like transporter
LSAGTWIDLFGVSVAIAALTVAEGLLVAGSAARRHDDPFDANGELVAMGIANVAGAVSSGMPIGASSSRAAATEAAGSRSQLAGLVSAAIVIAVALWLTGVVAEIPSAALAGLVANAVVAIIDVPALRTFARVRRTELYIAVGCAIAVLILGPIGGLVLAIVATMIDLVRRIAGAPWATLQPPSEDWEMARFVADTDHDAAAVADLEGISFVRLTGPLFFANADTLRARVTEELDGPARWVLLDFESVTDIDPTASDALHDVIEMVDDTDRVLGITRASAPVRALLDRYGLVASIGAEHIYPSNREGLTAYLDEVG